VLCAITFFSNNKFIGLLTLNEGFCELLDERLCKAILLYSKWKILLGSLTSHAWVSFVWDYGMWNVSEVIKFWLQWTNLFLWDGYHLKSEACSSFSDWIKGFQSHEQFPDSTKRVKLQLRDTCICKILHWG
jgi:hypothetical protein